MRLCCSSSEGAATVRVMAYGNDYFVLPLENTMYEK